jgi:acyl-CoA synthetase (AMP-forming)/AMP-acid ligase II
MPVRTPGPTWSAMVARWRGVDETAVITHNDEWSGNELLERAAGAADWLDEIGAPRGQPVAALVVSTASAFALAIGATGSHRPLAPLGPRLTAREIAGCVAGLGVRLLVTDPEYVAVARQVCAMTGAEIAELGVPPRSARPLDLDPAPESTMVILHTSGTTGAPRAVAYRQDRFAARVRVHAPLCNFEPGCRFASASPFHHIAGFGNHAVALAAGTAVVSFPRFTPDAWSALGEIGTTHAIVVPTVLEMLLDEGVLDIGTLRTLQYGAAPIHPDTLARTMRALPEVRLVNLYGQTEGSPITCLTAEDHVKVAGGRTDLLASVGRAAPGVEVHVEHPDEHGVGEVCARAEHLFLVDDDGWLRTGDMGRVDDDGYLHLVGRRGDKIIRGGENIYPVEVENVLTEHPAVREAAVVGVPDRRWGEIVCAFVVPVDASAPPDSDALRRFARERLAGFKVPSNWMFVDELPKSPTGKLLRRDLALRESQT